MKGFELQIFSVGSNWSINCASTTAQVEVCLVQALKLSFRSNYLRHPTSFNNCNLTPNKAL